MVVSGVLKFTRLNKNGDVVKTGRRRTVAIHELEHQVSYYADGEMKEWLGMIDLDGATVEYNPKVFGEAILIKSSTKDLVFKLAEDPTSMPLSKWFDNLKSVQKAIHPPTTKLSDIQGSYVLNLTVDRYRKDETSLDEEFGISCHAAFHCQRQNAPTHSKWISWHTYDSFKSFDVILKDALGWQAAEISLPRERKRDSFWGKGSSLKARITGLETYVKAIASVPNVLEFHKHHGCKEIRDFLQVDKYFGHDIKPTGHHSPLRRRRSSSKSLKSEEIVDSATTSVSPELSKSHNHRLHRRSSSKSIEDTAAAVPPAQVNTGDNELELVEGEEADALHQAIFKAVENEVKGDQRRVDKFKSKTRKFGRASVTAHQYLQYLVKEFGDEFATWLAGDIVHLVPNVELRRQLYKLTSDTTSKLNTEQQIQQQHQNPESTEKSSTFVDTTTAPPVSDNNSSTTIIPNDVTPELDDAVAKVLHQQILDRVFELFGKNIERVEDFQDQTQSFGKGEISAREYIAYLQGALVSTSTTNDDDDRDKVFTNLVLDMARLLADATRRLDLLRALESSVNRRRDRLERRRSRKFSKELIDGAVAAASSTSSSSNRNRREHSLSESSVTLKTRGDSKSRFASSQSAKHIMKGVDENVFGPTATTTNDDAAPPPLPVVASANVPMPQRRRSRKHISRSSSKDMENLHVSFKSVNTNDNDVVVAAEDNDSSTAPTENSTTTESTNTDKDVTFDTTEDNEAYLEEENPVLARLRKQGAVSFLP